MTNTSHTPTPFKTFRATFKDQPWRNTSFKVRGICKCDILNPCWDNRPDDIPGQHWSGLGPACEPCTKAALAKAKGE